MVSIGSYKYFYINHIEVQVIQIFVILKGNIIFARDIFKSSSEIVNEICT